MSKKKTKQIENIQGILEEVLNNLESEEPEDEDEIDENETEAENTILEINICNEKTAELLEKTNAELKRIADALEIQNKLNIPITAPYPHQIYPVSPIPVYPGTIYRYEPICTCTGVAVTTNKSSITSNNV